MCFCIPSIRLIRQQRRRQAPKLCLRAPLRWRLLHCYESPKRGRRVLDYCSVAGHAHASPLNVRVNALGSVAGGTTKASGGKARTGCCVLFGHAACRLWQRLYFPRRHDGAPTSLLLFSTHPPCTNTSLDRSMRLLRGTKNNGAPAKAQTPWSKGNSGWNLVALIRFVSRHGTFLYYSGGMSVFWIHFR